MCLTSCEELNDSRDDVILLGLNMVTNAVTLFEPVKIEELPPPPAVALQISSYVLSQAILTY